MHSIRECVFKLQTAAADSVFMRHNDDMCTLQGFDPELFWRYVSRIQYKVHTHTHTHSCITSTSRMRANVAHLFAMTI